LMDAGDLRSPDGAPTGRSRWVVVDLECQVLFAGEGDNGLVFVFPISSGIPEFPTRRQDASRVFRYDPASDNGGWHDSSAYPVSVDNPLNGNMYKPLYFDNGQALHGANNVPTAPASHGCVRLRVGHQDMLVNWIGLSGVDEATWDSDDIGLTVRVQGSY